jgi:UDP-2,3-diacylglucosamine pyrophosphatase LpxH
MVKNLKLITILVSFLCVSSVLANEIIVGPYLHFEEPGTMIIRWQTLEPTGSVLEFNTDNANFFTYEELSRKNDHEVLIQGIEEGAKYQYFIFDQDGENYNSLSNQAEIDSFYFKTRPGDDEKLSMWVLGDPGVMGDPNMKRSLRKDQLRVKKGFFKYLEKNEVQDLDYIVALGDNAYHRGTWQEYKDGFFDPYAEHLFKYPLYSVFGNHDQGLDKKDEGHAPSARSYPEPYGVYYDLFELPDAKAYYSLDDKNAHLIFLDSTDSFWEDYDGSNYEIVWDHESSYGNKMLEWLKNDLKNNDKKWTVVFFHHPPFGESEDPEEKNHDLWKAWTNAYIVPLLHEYNVDLVLMGHIHNYQRSYPLQIKEISLDRSKLKPKSNFNKKKEAFQKKLMETMDSLNLPRFKAYESAYEKQSYIKEHDPIYVVMGSSGAAFKELPEITDPAFFKRGEVAGSALLEITEEKIDFKFIDKKAKVFDQFEIKDRLQDKID